MKSNTTSFRPSERGTVPKTQGLLVSKFFISVLAATKSGVIPRLSGALGLCVKKNQDFDNF